MSTDASQLGGRSAGATGPAALHDFDASQLGGSLDGTVCMLRIGSFNVLGTVIVMRIVMRTSHSNAYLVIVIEIVIEIILQVVMRTSHFRSSFSATCLQRSLSGCCVSLPSDERFVFAASKEKSVHNVNL